MDARPVARETRWGLIAVAILVFGVGISLFLLSDKTDRFFSWTIKSPLTAAFLGAGYWSAFTPAVLATRQKRWSDVRVTMAGAFVFSTFTAIATFLHLDKFHLSSPTSWIWIAVYVIVPPGLIVIWIRQILLPENETLQQSGYPSWLRLVLVLLAVATLPFGGFLFAKPEDNMALWPWALTPLTARVIASALLTIGVTAIAMLRENDFRRSRLAAIAFVGYGILQSVNLFRFPNEVAWGQIGAWLYMALLAMLLVTGISFLLGLRKTPSSEDDIATEILPED